MAVIASPASGITQTEGDVVSGRWLGVGLLMAAYILNYLDRQILATLIEPVKAEIALTDTQVGLLTGTLFAVFYTFITIPIAMLADRTHRIRIVAAGCFIWSIFTGLTGFATSFAMLALARIGVAFGEAGGVAPSLSVLGDYFPPKRRILAISIFTMSAPIGITAGIMIGGFVAAAYGWRTMFFIAAIAGIVLVPLLLWLTPEPPRGNYEPKTAVTLKPAPFRETLALYFKRPTLAWMAISSGLFAAVANALVTWMPALLMRHYGMTLPQIAIWYGLLAGTSFSLGLFLSGQITSYFARRSVRAYALVPAAAMLMCAPFFVAALYSGSWQVALILLFIPFALTNFVVPPAFAVVQNLTPAASRSTASAILMLVLNLVGIGLGPLVVGIASDAFGATMGDAGLRWAMITALVPLMIVNAITLYVCSRYIVRDTARFMGETA